MNKILALIAATLTVTLPTGALATLASFVDAPNNSLATEALGSAASQPPCDDPFVAPVCARVNLFGVKSTSQTEAVMSFNRAPASRNADDNSRVGAVIDRGDLYVFEERANFVASMPQNFANVTSPPEFEGEESLTTPLPAAAPILIAGLAALGFFTRRRRTV